ncbi:histidinol dehydrogenase [Agrobacterium vitis]|uniref:type II toxin-antitoxin system VapB family antitoxin n=1 Tax=Allorhizobium ampelinum TaxID=3025782 RepID=UPI001F271B46|nr:type II toxin-antitoxin system VapB family antitoxin [Allorhizobium ampelinum]MCF1450171.1 histidinol dehydrogenase [Allorhizobium ampelinum]
MSFHIKGDDVRELAEQLKKLAGQPSMADAIRLALRNEIARRRSTQSIVEKVAELQRSVQADFGGHKVEFDMKEFWDRDEDN